MADRMGLQAREKQVVRIGVDLRKHSGFLGIYEDRRTKESPIKEGF